MDESGARTRREITTGPAGRGSVAVPEAGTGAALQEALPALARQLGRVADALERLGPEPDCPTSCGEDEAGDPLSEEQALDLLRGEPDEVLARLRDGDPLRIGGVCVAYVERHALLLQLDRVYERALLKAAVGAVRYEGTPPLDEWLRTLVAQSAYELLAVSIDIASGDNPTDPHWPMRYGVLAGQLGVEPAEARRMAIVFNGLDDDVRRAFFRVVLRGHPVAEFALAAGIAVDEPARLVDQARHALALPEGWRPPVAHHPTIEE